MFQALQRDSYHPANLRANPWVSKPELDDMLNIIIEDAIACQYALGQGQPSKVYEFCLFNNLVKMGFNARRKVSMLLHYPDANPFRDVIDVDGKLVVESVYSNRINEEHYHNIMLDVKSSGYEAGLFINFAEPLNYRGIIKIVGDEIFTGSAVAGW